MLRSTPGILLCDVSTAQGIQSTETLLQTKQNINSEANTYFNMLILLGALVFLVFFILMCMMCVYNKSSRKKCIEGVPNFLHPEDVIAKVHHFHRQKVQLVEQLGQGDYGVYWKAIVTGIAGDPAVEIQC
uniref:Uncharacterized protein n=1 Tax=Anopheles culicifacies TaxID=139723 RepID=A0A182LYJ7_9DIPT